MAQQNTIVCQNSDSPMANPSVKKQSHYLPSIIHETQSLKIGKYYKQSAKKQKMLTSF